MSLVRSLAAVLALSLRSAAAAQPANVVTPPSSQAVELAEEPSRLDNVGLSMRVPVGAVFQGTRVGDQQTAQIMPSDRTWLINIQTPQTSKATATIQEAAESTVALIQGSFGVMNPSSTEILSTKAKLLGRDSLQLKHPAERIYFSVPHTDGKRIVKGYTIFKPSALQFVVFELITAESEFARVRPLYETVVANASFADAEQLNLDRGAAVRAGVHLLATLSAPDYEAVLDGKERWHRLYRPAPGGAASDAEELGYRGIKFWKGKRGETNPERPRNRWNQPDNDDGYLAQVRVRVLDKDCAVDSTAIYFMTTDRKEETWSVRMTRRHLESGNDLGTWNEIGARVDKDLTVLVSAKGAPPREVKPVVEGDGYLTQVEAYLLPQLLIRGGAEAKYGFYTYRTDTSAVSFRRESLTKTPADGWVITTELREDFQPQVAYYTEQGEFIRSERSSESDPFVAKPIELDDLLKLWQRKKLPTGPTR
ncbi:MAG: hypothetical protein H7Y88_07085 [Phycisphaerales bacterium]|nr:hypothetical protein [Phycisphaerales bacterium]